MRYGRIAWVLCPVAVSGFLIPAILSSAADSSSNGNLNPKERQELGREAFTMNFARPSSQIGDRELGVRGNGLGPLLNETSCVNCHHLGGVGGGGGIENNVLMVGIVTRPNPGVPVDDLLRDARRIHPGFTDDSPVKVLHKFALAASEKVAGYDTWRDGVLAGFGVDPLHPTVLPVQQKCGTATVELVQRNTPALFGMGVLEKLRVGGGDGVRRKQAVAQAEKTPWITGRLPLTPNNKPGWYGARGHVDSLEGFVRSACANEMGLQVAGFPEVELQSATSPVKSSKSKKKDDSGRADLTALQTDALIAYVRDLPRPVQEQPRTEAELERLHSGQKAFKEFGCADCHVPDLGSAKGVYSDMLLHDMGERANDVQTAVPARRINRTVSQVATGGGGGGYGSTVSMRTLVNISVEEIPSNPEREWKTTPLWGVRDSYPYWHDGRSLTLEDAITEHAGEGERAATAYKQASPDRQQALIRFLETLQAPPSAEVAVKS